MRLWGGRFGADSQEADEAVAAFGRSIDVDAALAVDDLEGSIAHVRGLGRAAYRHFEDPPIYSDHHIGFRIASDG